MDLKPKMDLKQKMDLKKILLPRKNAKAERGCMVKTQEFMAEKKGIDVKN